MTCSTGSGRGRRLIVSALVTAFLGLGSAIAAQAQVERDAQIGRSVLGGAAAAAVLAVMPYVNIEHFPAAIPGTPLVPGTAGFSPDPLNYGWRDYGNRVGLWRMMDLMDDLGQGYKLRGKRS